MWPVTVLYGYTDQFITPLLHLSFFTAKQKSKRHWCVQVYCLKATQGSNRRLFYKSSFECQHRDAKIHFLFKCPFLRLNRHQKGHLFFKCLVRRPRRDQTYTSFICVFVDIYTGMTKDTIFQVYFLLACKLVGTKAEPNILRLHPATHDPAIHPMKDPTCAIIFHDSPWSFLFPVILHDSPRSSMIGPSCAEQPRETWEITEQRRKTLQIMEQIMVYRGTT